VEQVLRDQLVLLSQQYCLPHLQFQHFAQQQLPQFHQQQVMLLALMFISMMVVNQELLSLLLLQALQH
jgi:hypothetical protein